MFIFWMMKFRTPPPDRPVLSNTFCAVEHVSVFLGNAKPRWITAQRMAAVRLRHNPTNMRATSASICFIRNLYIIVIAQYDICNINLPSVQSLRKLLHTVYNAKKKSWGQNFKRLWTAVDMSVIWKRVCAMEKSVGTIYNWCRNGRLWGSVAVNRRHEPPVRRGDFCTGSRSHPVDGKEWVYCWNRWGFNHTHSRW